MQVTDNKGLRHCLDDSIGQNGTEKGGSGKVRVGRQEWQVSCFPFRPMPNTRIVNFTASCSKCGEVLDTNEASVQEVADAQGWSLTTEFMVGTDHECFAESVAAYVDATQGPSTD